MYELTTTQGGLLCLGVLAVATALVLAVFLRFPRASRVEPAVVTCPTLGRQARAELVRDAWTLRFTDVSRCSVLGQVGIKFCNRACLRLPIAPAHAPMQSIPAGAARAKEIARV